jgi:hypothetical protein
MSLVKRGKYLTHQSFVKKLTYETAIKFPTKAARRYKFLSRETAYLKPR